MARLALALALYTGGALWLLRRDAVRAGLAWAVVGGTLLAYAVVGVQGDPLFHLFTRTVSPVQTGASALATRIMAADGVQATLERWPDVMNAARDANLIHFTTSPPGQPLIHQALADLLDTPALAGVVTPLSIALRPYQCSDYEVMRSTRGEIVSAGLGLLMPLLAALAALPTYSAGRALNATRNGALRAALWWPLVPSALMFAPTWNTVYPALCIMAFALLAWALRQRQMLLALAAGLVMSLTTFLNFSVLPALLLFGLFTLGYCVLLPSPAAPSPAWRAGFIQAVVAGVWFGVGLLTVWAVFFVASSLTPLDLLTVTFAQHNDLVQRAYLPWLLLHPYDVLLFTGWPAAALAGWGVWWALRQARAGTLDSLGLLALSMALTLLLVNLSGVVQGENARILIFYTPFLLLAGLAGGDRQAGDRSPRWASPPAALMLAQALTVLVMGAVLPVVPLDLNPQPTGPRQDIGGLGDDLAWIMDGTRLVSAAYDGGLTLAEYRYVADPGAQAITFELLWAGEMPTERPYHFELVARTENPADGEVISEPLRWRAQGGGYLPTCWRAGETIRDTVVLRVPPVSQPVVWDVTLRAVDERTGDTLTPLLTLGPVRYP